jgi:hypothetical protein
MATKGYSSNRLLKITNISQFHINLVRKTKKIVLRESTSLADWIVSGVIAK